jgi:hypothetical protein
MHATWPIVFSALVAGAVGGFLIPDRPQSGPAAVAKAPAISERGSSDAKASTLRANVPAPKRNRALAAPDEPSAAGTRDMANTERPLCAIDSWPYRAPGCLDRKAAIEPGYTVVNAKRVDPAQSLMAEGNRAAESTAKSKLKFVYAPSARSEEDDNMEQAGGKAAKAKSRSQVRRERRARPAGRNSAENHYGREVPRVVIRGPDGRLYLAPGYRHLPPTGYYIR